MVFQKGNTLGGRPKGSKNKLTEMKDKIVQALSYRFMNDEHISDVTTSELVKFVQAISPKELGVRVGRDLTYITETPRPKAVQSETSPIHDTLTSDTDTQLHDTPETPETKGKHALSETGEEKNSEDL